MRATDLLPALLLLAACRHPAGPAPDRAELRSFADQHALELREFHLIQDDLVARTPMPMTLELGEAGTVLLHELYLIGRPEKAFLRADFTYLNSTGVPLGSAKVSLVIRDPRSGVEVAEARELDLPVGFALQPGSCYSSWIEAPTHGLHARAGWEWRIDVVAVPEGVAAVGLGAE